MNSLSPDKAIKERWVPQACRLEEELSHIQRRLTSTFRHLEKNVQELDGSGDKRKLTELKVDGIILWPNLNAAAANSLLILRFYTSDTNVKKMKGCNIALRHRLCPCYVWFHNG